MKRNSTTFPAIAWAQAIPLSASAWEVRGRELNQQGRIGQDLQSGQITARGAAHLESREARIDASRPDDLATHGGFLTDGGQNRRENSLSSQTYRDKHNDIAQPSVMPRQEEKWTTLRAACATGSPPPAARADQPATAQARPERNEDGRTRSVAIDAEHKCWVTIDQVRDVARAHRASSRPGKAIRQTPRRYAVCPNARTGDRRMKSLAIRGCVAAVAGMLAAFANPVLTASPAAWWLHG